MAKSFGENIKDSSLNTNISKKAFFLSDVHLGVSGELSSEEREKKLVKWLDSIKDKASEIYFLGDIFDFWFEYKHVIPKGFARLFGKISELTDSGIKIYYFAGNHDMWNFGYFEKELNLIVYRDPIEKQIGDKLFFIGHGDGLGPDDKSFKIMKKIFKNRISRKLFSFIHPRIGIGLANYFSRKSRKSNNEDPYLGDNKERLILYCKHKLSQKHYDYFIFGHRHIPLEVKLNKNSKYINTGDWIKHFSYAVFDGQDVKLSYYNS